MRRTIGCVYKLVSLTQLRVTLFLVARAESQKFGGEDLKWKFTTSCASPPYNLVFAMDIIVSSRFHTGQEYICLSSSRGGLNI